MKRMLSETIVFSSIKLILMGIIDWIFGRNKLSEEDKRKLLEEEREKLEADELNNGEHEGETEDDIQDDIEDENEGEDIEETKERNDEKKLLEKEKRAKDSEE